ncbi:MAG: dienelactone hydrolase family protein [Hydrogenophilales bacterium]|nr:dienelactone hydrolase family protein [Hydrogenophilales bacterium]
MKKIILFISLWYLAGSVAQAAVQGKEVSYQANGTTLKGYIAYDDAIKGKRPAVLVVHEWWGHNAYARKRADMLAELGYTALAVDMYGDGRQANHPDEAGKFATEVSRNMPMAKARFEAGMQLLRKQNTVDARQIAAIGYCFGGGVVLAMARMGEDLKGVASFHGSLGADNPAQPGKIKARIISFTGEDDPMVNADMVAAFKQEMGNAGANFRVVTYPGVKHSFTNPDADELGKKFNLPLAYNAAADKDSWQQAIAFLREVFAAK